MSTATFSDVRKALRVSQTELAKELGIYQTTVSLWEVGKTTPRGPMIERIVGALNDIMISRGSARRVNYDEVDAALLASAGVVRSPRVDVQGDLGAIDHRTTAPTAQGA